MTFETDVIYRLCLCGNVHYEFCETGYGFLRWQICGHIAIGYVYAQRISYIGVTYKTLNAGNIGPLQRFFVLFVKIRVPSDKFQHLQCAGRLTQQFVKPSLFLGCPRHDASAFIFACMSQFNPVLSIITFVKNDAKQSAYWGFLVPLTMKSECSDTPCVIAQSCHSWVTQQLKGCKSSIAFKYNELAGVMFARCHNSQVRGVYAIVYYVSRQS